MQMPSIAAMKPKLLFCTLLEEYEILTARIRRMREGNSFSLFVCPHLEGGGFAPFPSHNTSTGPMSFQGESTPSPSHNSSTGPISFLGVPWGVGVPQDQVPPSPSWYGVPPDRATGVLATRRGSMPLAFRRRTYLFLNSFYENFFVSSVRIKCPKND